jgi:hypothetical protein
MHTVSIAQNQTARSKNGYIHAVFNRSGLRFQISNLRSDSELGMEDLFHPWKRQHERVYEAP